MRQQAKRAGTSIAFDLLVARAVLLWPERATAGLCSARDMPHARQFDSHVRRRFADEAHMISATDLGAAYASFLRRQRHLVDWYSALLEGAHLGVDWRSDCPTIPLASGNEWTRLCNEFDPDTLLTFHLARKGVGTGNAEETIIRFSNWQTIPRVIDHDLAVLGARGLSDMHVHVGGVRIPHAAWLELLRSDRTRVAFRGMRASYKDIGRNFDTGIENARAARRNLLEMLVQVEGSPPPQFTPTTDRWWSWHPSNLIQERQMLLAAWHALCSATATLEIVRALDTYLDQKHCFFARAREPAFTAVPGLQYFADYYFRALQAPPARGRWRPLSTRYGSSKRLEMAPYGDACRYLMESANLQRVELRITPFDRAPDYWRFFTKWNVLKQQLDADLVRTGREPVEIRFAVHFKRSRGAFGQGSRSHTKTRLAELDKQSAALRIALTCPDRGTLLRPLERVDVAGQERDTSLATFAWHFRLLREDPDTMLALENDRVPPPWRSHVAGWKRLEERGLHKFAAGARRLGATVHAGEDFGDVLDGCYQIGAALDYCQLGAGDGIGHALVLAATTQPVASARYMTMPLGEAVDQLCWLRSLVELIVPPAELMAQHMQLDEAIVRAAEPLYRGRADLHRRATARDLVWLWDIKMGRRHDWLNEAANDAVKRELLSLEEDELFWVERDRFETVGCRRQFDALAQSARVHLLQRVCDTGVVVEMNPSSNLRISGARSAGTVPTVFLAKAIASGLQACVNTDNPGVFVSCVENEFALLLDGLREDGAFNAREIRDCLELARRVGVEYLR